MRFYILGLCAVVSAGSMWANPFAIGEVFVGAGSGEIKIFSQTGTLKQALNTTTSSSAETGGAFDSAGNFFTTGFEAHTLSKFDSNGNLVNANFATGFNTDPESIVFDNSGHMFVGQADGTHQVLEFNATTGGSPIAPFSPAPQDRGTDWIDLAADQHTLYHTSEGNEINRVDIGSGTVLEDFTTSPFVDVAGLNVFGEITVATSAPEPSSIFLLIAPILALIGWRVRRRQA